MADNNEKLEKDLQNQEADIEVDVTKDIVEEVEKQPEEEARKEATNDEQKESPEEESKEESETVETKNMQNSKKEENQKKGKPRNSAPKLKFSYKEEREYETIEDDIAALEEKADELEQEIVKCATDFVRLNELTKEKEEVDTALLEKMERWEYLEELAAKIKAQNT